MSVIRSMSVSAVAFGFVSASGLDTGNVMVGPFAPAWQIHPAAPGPTELAMTAVLLREAAPSLGESHCRRAGCGGLAAFRSDRVGVFEAILAESDELDNQINCVCRPGRYPAFGLLLHEHRFVMYAPLRTRTCVCKVSCIVAGKRNVRAKWKFGVSLLEEPWDERAFVSCPEFGGTFCFYRPRLPKLKPVGAMALNRGLGGWISER